MKKMIVLMVLLTLMSAVSVIASPPCKLGLEICDDSCDNDDDGFIDMVDPECELFMDGNPDCSDLGFSDETKIEEPDDFIGTWTFDGVWDLDGTNTFTVDTSDEIYFDWTATTGIDAVISKGSNGANVYEYNPEALSDTGLHSPVNNGGNIAAISHITICYDEEEPGVPEFTTIGAGLVLLGAGFFAYKKRK